MTTYYAIQLETDRDGHRLLHWWQNDGDEWVRYETVPTEAEAQTILGGGWLNGVASLGAVLAARRVVDGGTYDGI